MNDNGFSGGVRCLWVVVFSAGLAGCSSSGGKADGGGMPQDGGGADSPGDRASGDDVGPFDGGSDGNLDGAQDAPATASCNSSVGQGGARFAYVASAGGGEILTYAVAAGTGALTPAGSPVLASSPRQMIVDPSSKFLLVAEFGTAASCGTGCALISYAIDAATGALTPAGRGAAGTNPISLAVDTSSTHVYTVNTNSDNVSIFTMNPTTGALAASGTVPAGHFPEWVTLSHDGKFLYVANTGSNNVSTFVVDSSTGALTAMGMVAAGTSPTFVILHPTGKFAYVANPGSGNVSLYGRDTTTGILTPTVDIPAGTTARAIAIEPTGQFAYVADATQIMTFSIDAGTGLLTASGAPTPATPGSQPYYLTADPGGTHLYVGLQNTNAIEVFAIDKSTGALCPVGNPVTAGTDPLNVALAP